MIFFFFPQEFEKNGINPTSNHNNTYLDHFLLCTKNPTLQEANTYMQGGCMSKGGVPVQPHFVLGGFNSVGEDDVNYGSK